MAIKRWWLDPVHFLSFMAVLTITALLWIMWDVRAENNWRAIIAGMLAWVGAVFIFLAGMLRATMWDDDDHYGY